MSGFNVGIKIGGFLELANAIGVRGQALEQAKNAAVNAVAQRLQETAQAYAEGGHPTFPEVQTGELQRSITWEHVSDGVARTYTNLDYAYWVEFGHSQEPGRYVPDIGARLVQSFVPAYPFFRPAITQVIDGGEATQIMMDILQEAVRSGNGGGGVALGSGVQTALPANVESAANI